MTQTRSDLDRVVADLNSLYGEGQWLPVFGGDSFDIEKPDIAHVIKHLQDQHRISALAIQSGVVKVMWGGVDKHLDDVHYVQL